MLFSQSLTSIEDHPAPGIDGLILTLPDAPDERACVSTLLQKLRRTLTLPIYIKTAPLESERIDSDLAFTLPHAPDGIVLPACGGRIDIQHMSCKLAVHEAMSNIADGKTQILAEAAETPASCFTLQTYAGSSQRLAGLIHTPARLAAALNISMESTGEEESTSSPLSIARAQVVLAAASAGVAAYLATPLPLQKAIIDPEFPHSIQELHKQARRDGFYGIVIVNS